MEISCNLMVLGCRLMVIGGGLSADLGVTEEVAPLLADSMEMPRSE